MERRGPEGACGLTGVRLSSSPCRAMSHQILLLLAMLTLGLASSQHRDKVPCKKVREQSAPPTPSRASHCPSPSSQRHLMPLNLAFDEHPRKGLSTLFAVTPARHSDVIPIL